MDELISKYGWKKVAAVLVGVSVLFLLFVIVSFADIDKDANEQQKKRTAKGNEKESTSTISRQRNSLGSKRYSTDYYSIYYPDGYDLVSYLASGSVLSSTKFVDKYNSTILEIVIFDGSSTTLEQISRPYQLQKYSMTEVAYPWGQTTEYKGRIGTADRFQVVVIAKKGSEIIRILGSYSSKASNSTIESLFSSMVGSIN